jgi:hypothetical protein
MCSPETGLTPCPERTPRKLDNDDSAKVYISGSTSSRPVLSGPAGTVGKEPDPGSELVILVLPVRAGSPSGSDRSRSNFRCPIPYACSSSVRNVARVPVLVLVDVAQDTSTGSHSP